MPLLGVFEARLRDLKRLLAPARKQILQSVLTLTIFPLKIIKIYFCTSLTWQKKIYIEAKFYWFSCSLSKIHYCRFILN